ncbi:snake venom vascular endothelial growth factor F precursor [Bothrops jararaca]|uniref:Snake venom vascular endothelial growth factor F n=1 Tax=Bothrops jararaca TaxID=8724 RepID=A0A8T1N4Y8_BOTJA|nr:snake venom vascular endothelial growth factor F precursor [Bothrops jararaca]
MAAYLLAVAILFCIQGWPLGTVQGQVMPFMEVYRHSVCQPRETLSVHPSKSTLVKFPTSSGPSCVTSLRCGGCCNRRKPRVQRYRKALRRSGDHAAESHKGTSEKEVMQFTEHTDCECRPRSASRVNSRKHKRNPEEGEPRAKFPFV